MNNKSNLWLKMLGVLLLCALAGFYLYPPGEKLKLGIDLDGGYSMLYEIDDTGLDDAQRANLAESVITILKKRVDPDNVRNLVWRAIGANRIEIQMPRPSDQIQKNRERFDQAYNELEATNVTVSDLYEILRQPEPVRQQALDKLTLHAPQRKALLATLTQVYDARIKAEKGDTKAQADLDQAIDAVLATNFPMQQLMDALEMGQAKTVESLSARYPERKDLIQLLADAYGNWSKVKSGLDDPADLRRLLRGAGVLEFRILAEPSDPGVGEYVQQLDERGPRIRKGDVYGWFPVTKAEEFLSRTYVTKEYGGKTYVLAHLASDKGLTATGTSHPWKLVDARVRYDMANAGFAVSFQLDDWGGQLFSDLTARNIGKHLCILLDNEAISAPVIRSRIGSSGEITGSFTSDKANELSQVLNAGALPARLKEPPLSVRSIGPTLGETNREMGLKASYIGISAVLVFMLVYYFLGGAIADVAVLMNLLLTLGIMAAFEATFTLPGVAGLILSMAMAVDANVLIFERIREETERGQPLRLAVKNGYARAFSAIFDSNVTTLITTVILYYFGSEDIRGFALTLGLGLGSSMFTAIVVTRIVFDLLLAYGVIKSLPMMRLIRVPNINWWGLRRYFLPTSAILVVASLGIYFARDPQTLYDIEFLGGTSAQIELRQPGSMDDEQVRQMVTNISGNQDESAVAWLRAASDVMNTVAQSGVTQLGAGQFLVKTPAGIRPDLHSRQLKAFLEALNSPLVAKNGVQEASGDTRAVTVSLTEGNLDAVKRLVADAAKYLRTAADKMGASQVQVVREEEDTADKPRLFEIVTTETNEYIVREAILAVAGDALRVERAVEFSYRTNPEENNAPYFPIVSKELSEVLHDNNVPPMDVREYMGGVALVVEEMNPPITPANLSRRLREMRLQPDFEHYAWRQFEAVGLKQAGTDPETGKPQYTSMVVLVTDPNVPFDENRTAWETQVAQPESELTKAALNTERTLRKVVQFAPQVAGQTRQRAYLALGLSLIAIMIYIWVRFGTLRHGFGAVISLFHDVAIGMGVVAISAFLAYSPLGSLLLIGDYKVNLTIMAAMLTLVGYSLNDKIVVFDRIRENRGRLREITPQILNTSINQTLSRTLLTGVATLLVTVIMYIWGGPGIQGFACVMTIGTLAGTYSSIAIGTPILLLLSKYEPVPVQPKPETTPEVPARTR